MEHTDFHPFRTAEAKQQYYARYDEREKQWPIPFENRIVETSFGRTFVRVSGPAGAPPLVLLPGSAVNSLSWRWNIEALSANHQTFAVDNIYDCGRSVCTRPMKTIDDNVAWLDSFFAALGFRDKFDLLGMSYGGWLSGRYAVQFPERLARVVLLAPAATVLPVRWEFYVRAMSSALHPSLSKRFMYWMFEESVRKDEANRKIVDEIFDDSQMAMRCFKGKMGVFPTTMTDDELRSLKPSMLILIGDHEKLYDAKKAVSRVHALNPKIKAEIIPNAGHDLPLVQPEVVSQRVLEFLA
jgi:pimeloyl-ACP methyl ester carboxylesterase